MEIGSGIRRLGDGRVNVYLLEEAGAVTIVDAGVPGYWRELASELAVMRRSLADVRAVLLTHAHSDHMGFAERIRAERGGPIRVHEVDAAVARGEARPANRGIGSFEALPLLGFLLLAARLGGLRVPPLAAVPARGDGPAPAGRRP